MIYCELSPTVLVSLTTLNAETGNAMLARVSAFKELVACTLAESESCRPNTLHILAADLCSV